MAHISSTGGDVQAALTILKTIDGTRYPMGTFGSGVVGGPTIAIAAHGLKGFRTATAVTRFSFGEFNFGESDFEDGLLSSWAESLARDAQKPVSEVLGWVKDGVSFEGEEAIRNGLIDSISPCPIIPPPLGASRTPND